MEIDRENVSKFDSNDYEMLKNISENKAEEGDLTGSLSILFYSLEKDPKSPAILRDIANIYTEMDLFDLSANYWFRCLNTQSKDVAQSAYNGLAENFFYLNDMTTASYYVQKQLLSGGREVEFDEDFLDYLDSSFEEGSDYRISYPPEMADYSQVITEGRRLLKTENFAGAIKKFQSIPSESGDYAEALCNISICYYFLGENTLAEGYSLKALKIKKDYIFAICNLTSIYSALADEESRRKYIEILKNAEPKDMGETVKMATAFCENNEHAFAAKYLELLSEEKPYDITILFLLAVAYFNLERMEESIDCFKTITIICPGNPISSSMLDYALAVSKKKAKKPKLNYMFQLPKKLEREKRKDLDELISMSEKEINYRFKTDKALIRKADWCFYSDSVAKMSEAMAAIARLKSKEAEEYLLNVLIDGTVDFRVKEEIVRLLILKGTTKTVGIVLFNIYSRIKIKALEIEGKYSGLFCEGYARASGKLVTFARSKDYQDNLQRVAKRLYYTFKMNDFESLEHDERAIAALICACSEYSGDVQKLKRAANLFGVKKEKLKDMYTLVR